MYILIFILVAQLLSIMASFAVVVSGKSLSTLLSYDKPFRHCSEVIINMILISPRRIVYALSWIIVANVLFWYSVGAPAFYSQLLSQDNDANLLADIILTLYGIAFLAAGGAIALLRKDKEIEEPLHTAYRRAHYASEGRFDDRPNLV